MLFDELVKSVVVASEAVIGSEIDAYDVDATGKFPDVSFQPSAVGWSAKIEVCDLSRVSIIFLSQ